MNDTAEFLDLVEDTLGMLETYTPAIGLRAQTDTGLDSLLAQCQRQAETLANTGPPPLRVMHHFACTGGTLMSRAMASQPNTMLLSEVDPFSNNQRASLGFTPSDLIHLARNNRTPPARTSSHRCSFSSLMCFIRLWCAKAKA